MFPETLLDLEKQAEKTKSFGEYSRWVETGGAYRGPKTRITFRIAKARPNFAEIVCLSDIFRGHKYTKPVDLDSVRTWADFVDSCKAIADEHGIKLGDRIWSFSYRF